MIHACIHSEDHGIYAGWVDHGHGHVPKVKVTGSPERGWVPNAVYGAGQAYSGPMFSFKRVAYALSKDQIAALNEKVAERRRYDRQRKVNKVLSDKDREAFRRIHKVLGEPSIGGLVDAIIAAGQAQMERDRKESAQARGATQKAARAAAGDHARQLEEAVEKVSAALGTLCNELGGNIAHVLMHEDYDGVRNFVASLIGQTDIQAPRDLMYLLAGLAKIYGVSEQEIREEVQKKTTTSSTIFDYFARIIEKNDPRLEGWYVYYKEGEVIRLYGTLGEGEYEVEKVEPADNGLQSLTLKKLDKDEDERTDEMYASIGETPPEEHTEYATVCEAIDHALAGVKAMRTEAQRSESGPHLDAARDYSISITALEDARRRYVSGVAHRQGVHFEIDPDTEAGAALMQRAKIHNEVKQHPPFFDRSSDKQPAETQGEGLESDLETEMPSRPQAQPDPDEGRTYG